MRSITIADEWVVANGLRGVGMWTADAAIQAMGPELAEEMWAVVPWARPHKSHKSDDDVCATSAAGALCSPRGIFTSRNSSTQQIAKGANLPLELYADKFGSPADDWGARINAAIQAAYVGDDPAAPATIVLPVGKLSCHDLATIWVAFFSR